VNKASNSPNLSAVEHCSHGGAVGHVVGRIVVGVGVVVVVVVIGVVVVVSIEQAHISTVEHFSHGGAVGHVVGRIVVGVGVVVVVVIGVVSLGVEPVGQTGGATEGGHVAGLGHDGHGAGGGQEQADGRGQLLNRLKNSLVYMFTK
jgi:hypothetical protein